MSVEGIVALASLPIPILAALFWHVRVYSLYKMLGERLGDLRYSWFAFQLANPYWASKFPGYVDISGFLPEDLAARVVVVRRKMKWAELIVVCWMLVIMTLIGRSFRH